MATIERSSGNVRDDDALLARASELGFELTTHETDTGQIVWEWRHRDDGPRPQFVTERVARYWMAEWIAQSRAER